MPGTTETVDAVDADKGQLRRSVLIALAVGVPVAIGAAAVTYGIIAIPMYTLAQADPHGLDRPWFRHAMVRIALPIGAVIGLLVGSVVGVWYRRGGRLPTDRTPF